MSLPLSEETAGLFVRLLEIVERLRGPDGCPWDREQTPATIAPYLVEEAYEVQEAVERGDPAELREELGDVLLEVALLAQMAREQGEFTVADSLRDIYDKLVRRHPHVFGDARADTPDEVAVSWAQIKVREKEGRGVVEGVPRRLPALHRARRVSEKAAGVGFDWDRAEAVLEKVDEELSELRAAVGRGDREGAAEELGDLLFALVNLGRHLGVDAERALHGTVEKFLRRFARIEAALAGRGLRPDQVGLDELEALWQAAKGGSAAAETPAHHGEHPADLPGSERPGEPGVQHRPGGHEPQDGQ
ncbi:nucleoside triphosphate pyrophosphohydrolase [Deferrisoma camini]|uniref:nucleoside triphosphate pyrophosphohydrolase n=1 Tax=Deferrisoma camini TaxID=1035120 RepID=UPI00046D92DA